MGRQGKPGAGPRKARVGPRAFASETRRPSRIANVSGEQPDAYGLSALPETRFANRQRHGGIAMQDVGRGTLQARRHAQLEICRGRKRVTPSRRPARWKL